jgi:alkane 1-monooxygenase
MDRRLLEHYGGDVTRANIQPRKRDKLLRRYGGGGGAAAGEAAVA